MAEGAPDVEVTQVMATAQLPEDLRPQVLIRDISLPTEEQRPSFLHTSQNGWSCSFPGLGGSGTQQWSPAGLPPLSAAVLQQSLMQAPALGLEPLFWKQGR